MESKSFQFLTAPESESLWKPKIGMKLSKTALHQAVRDGRLQQVKLLLSSNVRDVNVKDANGWTPLMLACMLPREKTAMLMINVFMKQGADVNLRDNRGRTALMIACICHQPNLVRCLLLEEDLEMTAADKDGSTALIHAAGTDFSSLNMVLHRVMKFKIAVDTRNELGYTALLTACRQGRFENALLLLKVGVASPYLRDYEYRHNAVEWLWRYNIETNRQVKYDNRLPRLRRCDIRPRHNIQPEIRAMTSLLLKVYKPWVLLPRSSMHCSLTNMSTNLQHHHSLDNAAHEVFNELMAEISAIDSRHSAKSREDNSDPDTDRPRDRQQVASARLRRFVRCQDDTRMITLRHLFKLYSINQTNSMRPSTT